MSAQPASRSSLDEVVELEAAAEYKSESWDGQVFFAMAGGAVMTML